MQDIRTWGRRKVLVKEYDLIISDSPIVLASKGKAKMREGRNTRKRAVKEPDIHLERRIKNVFTSSVKPGGTSRKQKKETKSATCAVNYTCAGDKVHTVGPCLSCSRLRKRKPEGGV